MTQIIWHAQYDQQMSRQEESQPVYEKFFQLLKKKFGLTVIARPQGKAENFATYQTFLAEHKNITFSKREVECLYHFCQGKTYKQAAQVMGISPRTIETYLESIRYKTKCQNKVEVVSQFAQYFCDSL